jgi:hypothetical protein
MKRLIAFVIVAVASTASAETIKIPDAKVEVWYPEKWNVEKANGVVTITDPAEEAALTFLTIPGEKLDDAMNALDAQIAKMATDVTVTGKPHETSINGMKVVVADAKGKVSGKPCEISAALVLRPGKKLMLMLGIVESAKLKKHEAALTRVVASLKPTN